jgi:hypothetical protein
MIKLTDEMKVALVRGIASALCAGTLSFLAVWGAGEDSTRVLLTAGLTPAIVTLVARFGLEGTYDSRRSKPAPETTTPRTGDVSPG